MFFVQLFAPTVITARPAHGPLALRLDIWRPETPSRRDSRRHSITGTPEQVGQKCNIQWDLDTTGTWTSFEIQLMTGSNLNMVRRFGLDLGEGNLS